MTEKTADFLVIGGGMAGAAAAYAASAHGRVILLEAEDNFARHTTGRSAAFFIESYGGLRIQALTALSKDFLFAPPEGFSDSELAAPRAAVYAAAPGQEDHCPAFAEQFQAISPGVRVIDKQQLLAHAPMLRPEMVSGGVLDPGAAVLDVHALQQGFLASARRKGLQSLTNARVDKLQRKNGLWQAQTTQGDFAAPIVINAAGAWGDELAKLAGIAPIGLEPKRRTVIVFPLHDGVVDPHWPLVFDLGEEWYFKPESGRILASPGDETPSQPCDAQPEELDIAITVDRIERVTNWQVRRIESKWAGLRSFTPDRAPVVGFEPTSEGFFWCVGQGGFGIQSAPAMAQLMQALLADHDLPESFTRFGLTRQTYAADRFRSSR